VRSPVAPGLTAHRWAPETYLIWMLLFSQKSQNACAVKLEPKFVMIVLGKPNRCKMSQMKSTYLTAESFVIGLYSIHFVNLLIATYT
jgi:hypothetical protein